MVYISQFLRLKEEKRIEAKQLEDGIREVGYIFEHGEPDRVTTIFAEEIGETTEHPWLLDKRITAEAGDKTVKVIAEFGQETEEHEFTLHIEPKTVLVAPVQPE